MLKTSKKTNMTFTHAGDYQKFNANSIFQTTQKIISNPGEKFFKRQSNMSRIMGN
ncbi:MAG: hypothetical protein CM1200mP30_07860 [Pseudomonadota bacterium]|nr:MAG: hypothetical protein CM1200mP30_07860 [Pseudomonadota bacterium]